MNQQKDNLYIVRVTSPDGRTLSKIGYSGNIPKRMEVYMYHNPFVEVIGTLYYEDGKNLEKHIHKIFKSERFNEWYTDDVFQEILEYLNTRHIIISNSTKSNDWVIDKDFHKEVLNKLSPLEYHTAMKLALNINSKTNRLFGLNSKMSDRGITTLINSEKVRKCIRKIISKLLDKQILYEDEISFILNPKFLHFK